MKAPLDVNPSLENHSSSKNNVGSKYMGTSQLSRELVLPFKGEFFD